MQEDVAALKDVLADGINEVSESNVLPIRGAGNMIGFIS